MMDDDEIELYSPALIRRRARADRVDDPSTPPPLFFDDPLLMRLRAVHVEPRYDYFKGYKPRK